MSQQQQQLARSEIPDVAPTSAEERRRIALAIAPQCIQLLKQEFNAAEVIVFGSLRGDAPWHDESDLDLAVRGMSAKAIWDALPQLESIVPSWLPFDLVSLDRADQRVRNRILQTEPMPNNKYAALKLRLEDELAAIDRLLVSLDEALAQAGKALPVLLTPALASYVENFYSGCEKLAERVAVEIDGGLPKGSNWHEQLLMQMSEPGEDNRPPLWNKTLLKELDAYRRFRHRVRHLYNFELDDEAVLAIAQKIPAVFQDIQQAVTLFGDWLAQQANS